MNDMKSDAAIGLFITRLFFFLVTLTALLLGVVQEGYGQDQVRRYADFQGSLQSGTKVTLATLRGTISNAQYAIDHSINTHSQLNISISAVGSSASVKQYLAFSDDASIANIENIPAHTPITIKLTLPQSILGIADVNLEIGHFRNIKSVLSDWPTLIGPGHDAGHQADETQVYNNSQLLSLLSSAGTLEVTITPNEDYQGIYIKLGAGILGINPFVHVYHAYVMEELDPALDCEERNTPIDVLSGVRAGGVTLANATGSVNNPYAVMDGNESTFSQINVGLSLLSEVYHTTIFPTKSSPKDEVELVLQNSTGGLLELDLLTGFSIQPFLGNNPVGSPINSNSNFLSLSLLPGAGNKYKLKALVNGEFDRIEIKMGGVAEALSSLRIYEINRKLRIDLLEEPTLSRILNNCEVDLKNTIRDLDEERFEYNYYTSEGDPLTNSIIIASGDYFIESTDTVTGCTSERVRVTASILAPGRALLEITETNN